MCNNPNESGLISHMNKTRTMHEVVQPCRKKISNPINICTLGFSDFTQVILALIAFVWIPMINVIVRICADSEAVTRPQISHQFPFGEWSFE